ncbi:MAG: SpoIIE family protein phosphatase [Desulfocapsaceae bacterium]|nr:SpoIIE family protein phosphatase [Desulfocapsaceae bacterium]
MFGRHIKLRWKYFIILLIASLLPMLLVAVLSHKGSSRLGKAISKKTTQELSETVRREIITTTQNYANIVQAEKTSIEFALRFMAREAELALSLSNPEPEKVYYARDYDDPATAPGDLMESQLHKTYGKDGKTSMKKISLAEPNYVLAPGVQHQSAEDNIARLARLTPTFRMIRKELGEEIYWLYIGLEEGIHIAYPGHGGYPDDFDPRQRPWYVQAKQLGHLQWGPPIVDVTTKRLLLTASAPFYELDGSLAGVAGIDLLIPAALLQPEVESDLTNSAKSFLLGREKQSGGESSRWILSQATEEAIYGDEITKARATKLISQEEKDFESLWPYLVSGKSGSVELPFGGKDSFWAFATISEEMYFVLVAPKSLVTRLPEEVAASFKNFSQGQGRIIVVAMVIVLILVAVAALIVSRSNTKNVMSMVSGFKKLEQGDFSVRLRINYDDERDMVVHTFNQIVPKLEDQLRMSKELSFAKEVQQSLLPQSNPVFPGFEIVGQSIYCEETGGDYYDFIQIDKQRLAIVVGDVSGHGVSSALLMATARAQLMQRVFLAGSCAKILDDVNKQLCRDTQESGNFMTMFYAEIDAEQKQFFWTRAGHDPAILYDPKQEEFMDLKGKGLALGVFAEYQYEQNVCALSEGQIVCIATDGIWEITNPSGEMFGKDRIKEIIQENCQLTASQLLSEIMKQVKTFCSAEKPDDDITLVLIKVA